MQVDVIDCTLDKALDVLAQQHEAELADARQGVLEQWATYARMLLRLPLDPDQADLAVDLLSDLNITRDQVRQDLERIASVTEWLRVLREPPTQQMAALIAERDRLQEELTVAIRKVRRSATWPTTKANLEQKIQRMRAERPELFAALDQIQPRDGGSVGQQQ